MTEHEKWEREHFGMTTKETRICLNILSFIICGMVIFFGIWGVIKLIE